MVFWICHGLLDFLWSVHLSSIYGKTEQNKQIRMLQFFIFICCWKAFHFRQWFFLHLQSTVCWRFCFTGTTNIWRIDEKKLLYWEFFFGWPGALFAQRIFRHKNSKSSFMRIFYLAIICNIAVLVLLFLYQDDVAKLLKKLQSAIPIL